MFQLKDTKNILQTVLLFRQKKLLFGKVLLSTYFNNKNWVRNKHCRVKKSGWLSRLSESYQSSVSFGNLPLKQVGKNKLKNLKWRNFWKFYLKKNFNEAFQSQNWTENTMKKLPRTGLTLIWSSSSSTHLVSWATDCRSDLWLTKRDFVKYQMKVPIIGFRSKSWDSDPNQDPSQEPSYSPSSEPS